MKKILLVSALVFLISQGFSQSKSISYLNWSNQISYKVGPPPEIVGYGPMSSILSTSFDVDFFVFGDEYFKIDSWASYYYWFTQRYFYLFEDPDLYEYFYETNNNVAMVRFISQNYRGKNLPIQTSLNEIKGSHAVYATNDRAKAHIIKLDIEEGYNKKSEQEYLKNRKKLKKEKVVGVIKVDQKKLVKYNTKNNRSNYSKSNKSESRSKSSNTSSKINSGSNQMNFSNSSNSSSSSSSSNSNKKNTGNKNNILIKK